MDDMKLRSGKETEERVEKKGSWDDAIKLVKRIMQQLQEDREARERERQERRQRHEQKMKELDQEIEEIQRRTQEKRNGRLEQEAKEARNLKEKEETEESDAPVKEHEETGNAPAVAHEEEKIEIIDVPIQEHEEEIVEVMAVSIEEHEVEIEQGEADQPILIDKIQEPLHESEEVDAHLKDMKNDLGKQMVQIPLKVKEPPEDNQIEQGKVYLVPGQKTRDKWELPLDQDHVVYQRPMIRDGKQKYLIDEGSFWNPSLEIVRKTRLKFRTRG